MPLSFAVVCEAPADAVTACCLADRVLCAEVEWIVAEVIEEYRRWRGLRENEVCLTWRDVASLAQQKNLRVHGHFGGKPGEPDARAARLALRLLKDGGETLDGVFLIRDDDRQVERRRGLDQARTNSGFRVPIVIGLAHTKRECWVLAGFQPKNQAEQQRLDELREELKFDPCNQAQLLTGKRCEAKCAKRALDILCGADRDREADC
jgi:hypothetical protein